MTSRTRQVVLSGLALVGTMAVLAGCSAAPSETASAKKTDFRPCMVSDAGGFDDKSFNQLGYEGMLDAAKELGADTNKAESKDATVYDSNIEQLINQNCNMIITVGFNLADATKKQAAANPDTEFAIIDDNSIDAKNVKPITFDTSQAAFLAGYAAASYSKTGVVGTFGGMQIPTVTIFMDGFADGVQYYNEQKKKDVKVVGWNVETGKGSFTGGFEAGTQAKSVAQTLLDQDADVILPVGGPIYQSAAEAIKDADNGSVLIGADSDLYEADPRYKDIAFTSVMKGMRPAVKDVVEQAADDKFSKEPYVGTLENDGVGIAPFHDYESKVDSGLQDELDTIKSGIIDGSIKVETQSNK